MPAVQRLRELEHQLLVGSAHRFRPLEVEDRAAGPRVERRALVERGKEAGRRRVAAALGTGDAHRDVSGHFLIHRAERVSDPATERRKTGLPAAGMHGQQGFAVIDVLRHARTHHRDLIHDLRQVRQQLGHFDAGLPVFREFERAGHQLRRPTNGSLHDGAGYRLAVVLLQHRFRIEQIHLARPAAHVEHHHPLRTRGKLRRFRDQIGAGGCLTGEQRVQRQRAEATGEPPQRLAPSQCRWRVTAAGETNSDFCAPYYNAR